MELTDQSVISCASVSCPNRLTCGQGGQEEEEGRGEGGEGGVDGWLSGVELGCLCLEVLPQLVGHAALGQREEGLVLRGQLASEGDVGGVGGEEVGGEGGGRGGGEGEVVRGVVRAEEDERGGGDEEQQSKAEEGRQ